MTILFTIYLVVFAGSFCVFTGLALAASAVSLSTPPFSLIFKVLWLAAIWPVLLVWSLCLIVWERFIK